VLFQTAKVCVQARGKEKMALVWPGTNGADFIEKEKAKVKELNIQNQYNIWN